MYTDRGIQFTTPSQTVSEYFERGLFPCTAFQVGIAIELQLLRRIVDSVNEGVTLTRACKIIVAGWFPFGFEVVQPRIKSMINTLKNNVYVAHRVFRALLVAVRQYDPRDTIDEQCRTVQLQVNLTLTLTLTATLALTLTLTLTLP